MAFDPETAYSNDWRYMDRVHDVSWERSTDGGVVTETGLKARWARQSKSDIQNVAAGLGVTSEAAAIVVWQPKPSDVEESAWEPSFAPSTGQLLRVDLTKDGWLILSASQETSCKWLLACEREVVNG